MNPVRALLRCASLGRLQLLAQVQYRSLVGMELHGRVVKGREIPCGKRQSRDHDRHT